MRVKRPSPLSRPVSASAVTRAGGFVALEAPAVRPLLGASVSGIVLAIKPRGRAADMGRARRGAPESWLRDVPSRRHSRPNRDRTPTGAKSHAPQDGRDDG